MSYFKSNYFLKNINADMQTKFADVNLYTDNTKAGVNFEYLFNLASIDGKDPDASSLFNLTTLRALLNAGKNTVDIIEDKTVTADKLDLSKFTDVTTYLKLE
jgi:hypothetical protein